ncbi:hypothetical protein FRC11_012523 [Ceratobasidium sp. 423]|nr:hypothetical protein FRC11_012523 [Ceratobasidium sp. 423]
MHIPIPGSTFGAQTSWRSPRRVESIYLLFDSHPRPNHPKGAAVQILPSRSTDDVANYLVNLFQVDQDIMNDPDLEWTVQLLGQLSYHLLAPTPGRKPVDEYALNMRILEGDWKRTQAEDKQKAAEAETRRLQEKIATLEAQDQKARDEIQSLKEQLNRRPPPSKEEQKNSGWFTSGNKAVESSKSKGKGREVLGSWQPVRSPREETMFTSRFEGGRGGGGSIKSTEKGWDPSVGTRASPSVSLSTRTSGAPNFERPTSGKAPARPPSTYASVSSKASGSSKNHSANVGINDVETTRSLELAMKLQHKFDQETIEIPSTKDVPSNSEPNRWRKVPVRSARPMRTTRPYRPMRPLRPPKSASVSSGPGKSSDNESTPPTTEELDTIRSLELAARLQSEFDDETAAISKDESLAKSLEQATFDCGICMDTYPDEKIALVEECGHSCCRDCMRGNIEAMIEDRRYPLPCPFCAVEPDDNDGEQRAVGSSNSVFVDREEYNEEDIIACPMRCGYKWCKECSQPVQGEEKHSCDGSAELEALMNQLGWKHCPGCRTPVEKYTGCNHVSCKTPGCNVHFCFACEKIISVGGTLQEISQAKSNHFQSCTLWGAPPAA